MESQLAENLVGVIKSIVRDELREREKAAVDVKAGDRAGARWTSEEKKVLVREFSLAVELMSVLHRRSRGGITSRLEALYRAGDLYCNPPRDGMEDL